ncbi:DMT family transporter [Muricoccus radiodurans]|uniref:DMT family transporter n=1 Tax=Muricoccus radiodurans TaxID=2231721 RepID=UPI003CEAC11A
MTTAEAAADRPLRGILLITASIALFSVSDALAKLLTGSLPPVEVGWLRYVTFFALTLTPFLFRRNAFSRALRPKAPGLQLLRGLGMLGSAIAFIFALRVMPIAEATAINFVSPAFITALSIPVLGEVVGWRRWTAVAVGLVGVLIVIRPGTGAFGVEALLPIATAATWACAAVITRRLASAGDGPEVTLFWSAGVGLVVLTAALPFDFVVPTAGQVGLGVLVGVISSVGHSLVVLAYRAAPASVIAPFSYLQLLFSTLMGIILFGAAPDRWTALGAVIITASGLYTAHRERVRARERLSR